MVTTNPSCRYQPLLAQGIQSSFTRRWCRSYDLCYNHVCLAAGCYEPLPGGRPQARSGGRELCPLPQCTKALPLGGMKHSGKARKAAFKLILYSLIALGIVWALGAFTGTVVAIITAVAVALTPVLVGVWAVFAIFTLYFFRDPNPRVPAGANLVVAPGHGKVDVIGTTTEPEFMGGECQRVSIFLSVFDVHTQNAPVGGKVAWLKYTMGEFLNALKAESAIHNENVLLGFEASEPRGKKVGVRLIAGVIARRIVPFVRQGDEVARGERVGLIQFGSRVDLYLPPEAKIRVKVGDRVVGGETVVAAFE